MGFAAVHSTVARAGSGVASVSWSSGVAAVPLQLRLGSPSLGRRGPRDMETGHVCNGVPVRVRQSFAS